MSDAATHPQPLPAQGPAQGHAPGEARTAEPAARAVLAMPARTGLLPWLVAAAILAVLPFVFRSGTALTMMSLMGIAIIFALSFNMLLGETGMLSFGHAVYYGLAGFITIHAMNWVIRSGAAIPLPLMPFVGAATGLFFAVLFGWVSTRRSGTAFSMISLGLAELIASSALILRSFFGGEEGITTNRTKLPKILGVGFSSQFEVYYLIAAWLLIAAALMYFITRTPFGRMCNAVRDNPDRVAFVGYDPGTIRYIAFCLSGLFAGIAGALAALNFEIANSAYVGAAQSGIVLLATVIGGAGAFIGPILGAILVTALQVSLSDITEIWQLYFGLLFIGVILFVPGGIAGLILRHVPLWRQGTLAGVLPSYLLAAVPLAMVLAGLILAVEMIHHVMQKAADGPMAHVFRQSLDTRSPLSWALALGLFAAGLVLLRFASGVVGRSLDRASGAARTTGART